MAAGPGVMTGDITPGPRDVGGDEVPAGLSQFNETQPIINSTTFVNADGTTAKSILIAQSAPWRLDSINVTSDDTAALVIRIFQRAGSTNFLLGSISLPAGAGTAGALPKEFFKDGMPDTEQGLAIMGSTSLQASMESAVTAAKTVTVTVFGGLF